MDFIAQALSSESAASTMESMRTRLPNTANGTAEAIRRRRFQNRETQQRHKTVAMMKMATRLRIPLQARRPHI